MSVIYSIILVFVLKKCLKKNFRYIIVIQTEPSLCGSLEEDEPDGEQFRELEGTTPSAEQGSEQEQAVVVNCAGEEQLEQKTAGRETVSKIIVYAKIV